MNDSSAESMRHFLKDFDSSLYMSLLEELAWPNGIPEGQTNQTSYIIQLLRMGDMEAFLQQVGQQDNEVSWLENLRVLYEKTRSWMKAASFQDLANGLKACMPTPAGVRTVCNALQGVIKEHDQIKECYTALTAGADVVEQLQSFAAQLRKIKDTGTLEFFRPKGRDGNMTVKLCYGTDRTDSWQP